MSMEITPFYDKNIDCLVCKTRFTTKRIRSRFIRVKKVHSDFYTEYRDDDVNPYFYEVFVCPSCGYAATDQFSNRFPEGSKERITSEISDVWNPRDFGNIRTVKEAIVTYKLASLCGSMKNEANIVMAGIAIRLAWLYRISKDEEQERRFLNNALNYYEQSYSDSDFLTTQMTEIRLLYLIGELKRRLGEEKEAVQFFSRVIHHRSKDLEGRVVEMAREQWQKIRHGDGEENED